MKVARKGVDIDITRYTGLLGQTDVLKALDISILTYRESQVVCDKEERERLGSFRFEGLRNLGRPRVYKLSVQYEVYLTVVPYQCCCHWSRLAPSGYSLDLICQGRRPAASSCVE